MGSDPHWSGMPPTEEIQCTDEDCFVDLIEIHYTYDVPSDHDVTNLRCPACQGADCLTASEV